MLFDGYHFTTSSVCPDSEFEDPMTPDRQLFPFRFPSGSDTIDAVAFISSVSEG
jgi:hypothetical protein